jgi:hypothetical protein
MLSLIPLASGHTQVAGRKGQDAPAWALRAAVPVGSNMMSCRAALLVVVQVSRQTHLLVSGDSLLDQAALEFAWHHPTHLPEPRTCQHQQQPFQRSTESPSCCSPRQRPPPAGTKMHTSQGLAITAGVVLCCHVCGIHGAIRQCIGSACMGTAWHRHARQEGKPRRFRLCAHKPVALSSIVQCLSISVNMHQLTWPSFSR